MIDDDPIEVESFHATEMGWVCVDREQNVWESPTGEFRIFPRGHEPGFQVLRRPP